MALSREKIERLEIRWTSEPWKKLSYSRKWLKKQMNKFIRIRNKKIDEDDVGCKQGRKPLKGWEY